MRKVYCHNLIEAKTLLDEAADRDDLSFDNCQWLTHEGKPLGQSKLAQFWGVHTDYDFIAEDTPTRLELLCKAHGQQGGTIHQFNRQYAGIDFLQLTENEFNTALKIIKANRKENK